MPTSRKWAGWATVIAAAGVASGVAYATVIRPEFVPRRFGEVVAGKVYRSGRLTPGALARLHEKYKIRTVIDFGAWEPGSADELREQRAAEALGMSRVVFRLEGDSRGDPNAYVRALRIMSDPAMQPVLVHCSAGTERTGCAVMLYRTLEQNVTDGAAYQEAQAFEHEPSRNPYLMETFTTYKGAIKESLRTGVPIPFEQPKP